MTTLARPRLAPSASRTTGGGSASCRLRDRRRPTRAPARRLSAASGVPTHTDQHRRIRSADDRFGEGFRTRALCGPVARGAWAGVRKPPKEETAGRRGPFGERDYGDLRIADCCRAGRWRPAALVVFSGSGDGGRFRRRRCTGAWRWGRSKEDRRARAGVALVFRRAAGGEGDRGCAAGCGATIMSCRF